MKYYLTKYEGQSLNVKHTGVGLAEEIQIGGYSSFRPLAC